MVERLARRVTAQDTNANVRLRETHIYVQRVSCDQHQQMGEVVSTGCVCCVLSISLAAVLQAALLTLLLLLLLLAAC
jgi:hypothetical protein